MINSQELVFVVDENNQPLDPQVRSVVHKNGLWHRTSGIWVINDEKQILCQKRSMKKDVNPGIWETFFGGHLEPGEEYLHNAASEASEELGIPIDAKDIIPYKVFKSDKPNHKEFQHVFGLILNKETSEFAFEKDEIDSLQWKEIDELKRILTVDKDKKWVIKPWDREVLNWLLTF